jgi:hypothetical protein
MKKIKYISFILALLCLSFLLFDCSTTSYKDIYPILRDGKYDSEFPYKGASEELREISQTVQRIQSSTFYRTYTFDESAELKANNFDSTNLKLLAITEGYADQSMAGTGTVVYAQEGKVVILTCAHIVQSPDTIISYFPDSAGNYTNNIQALFIKERQVIYVAGFPEGSVFDLLIADSKNDLALIGKDYKIIPSFKFPALSYPVGKAKELDWGTFVYVFGYPLNYQMVTKAIVSNPNRDESGSFVIDAVVNNGMSGGLVLAIRDGVPNFEMVGIIQRIPEEEENVLVPKKLKNNERYSSIVPYEGEEYVKRFSSIRYGIARVISSEAILEFFERNKNALYNMNYQLDKFIK